MKCPMCSNEIQQHSLIGPFYIHNDKGESIQCCGRCFLLTSILDMLKEIKDGKMV